jgi:phosphoketolase
MLSEHQCEGWREGYLLTGRHGMFNTYEAFVRIVDSMFSQHAKWLKVTGITSSPPTSGNRITTVLPTKTLAFSITSLTKRPM